MLLSASLLFFFIAILFFFVSFSHENESEGENSLALLNNVAHYSAKMHGNQTLLIITDSIISFFIHIKTGIVTLYSSMPISKSLQVN